MSKTYKINPVTRIEGSAEVDLYLENGQISDAHFKVLEFKGFEKYLEGRMVQEMPRMTTRACGICPVSHHLAAAKATDQIFEVDIPKTAEMLRELMHMGQFIHSHALHFFFLAAPDLVLGPDSDPLSRNVLGILKANKELVNYAIKIRKVGQNIIRTLGGKAIHPVSAIPGGISKALDPKDKDKMLKDAEEILSLTLKVLEIGKETLTGLPDVLELDSSIKTLYMGTVKDGDVLNLYDGSTKVVGADGSDLVTFKPNAFDEYVAERTESYSYLKFPYYKTLGWPAGIYRVGPLGRLNVAKQISTEKAGQAFKEFREQFGHPAHNTFLYHYTRLIEMLYANEKAIELLEDPEIIGTHVNEKVKMKAGEGVGIVEAPRGTLIHHYKADSMGKVEKANLIVATVQNNPGINLSVKNVAEKCLSDGIPEAGMLNRVEMAVRAYDPCLTCAAHTIGKMPLKINFFDENGLNRTISR